MDRAKPSVFKDYVDFRLWLEYYASDAERSEIVRAVNTHEELLTTLKHALAALNDPKNESLGNDVYEEILRTIAKAEGNTK